MGKVIPFRRWSRSPGGRRAAQFRSRWFGVAMIALPMGAFSAIVFAPSVSEGIVAEAAVGFAGPADSEQAYFPICDGPERVTCVVDGDTIWYRGQKIRLVGFDTPEISNPGCDREARLGDWARMRLQKWLNAGAFSLDPNPDGRDRDRYGRSLLVVSRGGENVGAMLLAEGLAERRGGRTNVWCS